MTRLDSFETAVRRIGGLVMLATLLPVLTGLVRAARRPGGRTTGAAEMVLQSPVLVLIAVPYFAVCLRMWRGLRLTLSTPARVAMLTVGSLLYFPGMALVLWGRLAIGEMYNVSSGFGGRLHVGHRLITNGPYEIVRHPMYAGLLMASLGGLLIYRTWTLVYLLANAVIVAAIRGTREEQILAAEFGQKWQEYSRRVPFLIPRPRR